MRTKIKNQLKGVGIVIIVMGIVFAGLGLHAGNRQTALDTRGVTEPAEITNAAIESGAKGDKRYILTVQWGETQARQTQKFAISKADYEKRVDAAGKLLSPKTTVRHIPGQAGTALMDGVAYPFAGVEGYGYVVVGFGALLFLLGVRMRPDPAA